MCAKEEGNVCMVEVQTHAAVRKNMVRDLCLQLLLKSSVVRMLKARVLWKRERAEKRRGNFCGRRVFSCGVERNCG